MKTTYKTNMRKYQYTSVDTEKLEIIGQHATIATLTKREALILAQSLIDAATNDYEENVRMSFDMVAPTRIGDAPELHLSLGTSGYFTPQLHWAMIEGHLIFELSQEWCDENGEAE